MRRSVLSLCLLLAMVAGARSGPPEASPASRPATAAVDFLCQLATTRPAKCVDTAHFVLAHTVGPELAAQAGTLLERVYATFYDGFERAGFKLQPLKEQLVW